MAGGNAVGYPFAYAYLIAFVSMIVLATLLAVAPSPNKTRVLHTCLVALLAGWTLADFLSSIAETPAELATLAKVFAPVWAAVPFTFLLTVLVYTGWPSWTRRTWVRAALALPALACVHLVHTGRL